MTQRGTHWSPSGTGGVRRASRLRAVAGVVVTVLIAAVVLVVGSTAQAAEPFVLGDVFIGSGSGQITQTRPDGTTVQVLDTTLGSNEQTGMCGNLVSGVLLTTNFSDSSMSEFDDQGNLLQADFAAGNLGTSPESCVFNQAGEVYVGHADGDRDIRKLDADGNLLDTYDVETGDRGTDWIDLAADQCTMYYTSEGTTVYRYDVCTKTQLAPLTTSLNRPCFALRLRDNDELMVACSQQVYRLGSDGGVLDEYTLADLGYAGDTLFALSLDPDGTTYWTTGFNQGRVVRVDIASGAVVEEFTKAPIGPTNAGLAVWGERTQGGPTTTTTTTAPADGATPAAAPAPVAAPAPAAAAVTRTPTFTG